MTVTPDLIHAFAPTGTLRAAINLGNPILAGRAAQGGAAVGVSVDLAQALAQRLGVGLSLVVVETASASVDAVRGGQADVGFFAIDPLRGEGIAFTAPYVLIEGAYAVPEGSALQRNEDVDQSGVRVVVAEVFPRVFLWPWLGPRKAREAEDLRAAVDGVAARLAGADDARRSKIEERRRILAALSDGLAARPTEPRESAAIRRGSGA